MRNERFGVLVKSRRYLMPCRYAVTPIMALSLRLSRSNICSTNACSTNTHSSSATSRYRTLVRLQFCKRYANACSRYNPAHRQHRTLVRCRFQHNYTTRPDQRTCSQFCYKTRSHLQRAFTILSRYASHLCRPAIALCGV